jgi:Putative MetA-pathway of phenol degradation
MNYCIPNWTLHAIAACALVLAPRLAGAAEAETDVIGKGKTQLELKLAAERDSGSDLRTRYTPLLARIGLADSLELRLETDGRIIDKSAGMTTRGWGDAAVGLRLNTQELDADKGVVGTAWQLELGLPTGSGNFRAPSVSTALKFAAEWALPGDASIGMQPGAVYQRNDAGKWFGAPSLAVTLGKNWTSALRTTAEIVAPQLASRANGGNLVTFNLGATYRLSEQVELEAVYLRGLTNSTPAHGIVAGVNLRF